MQEKSNMRKATLILLHTDDGGRKSPILSGYRPHFIFENDPATDGRIETELSIAQGETYLVTIKFIREPSETATKFNVMEGNRIVGTGKLL